MKRWIVLVFVLLIVGSTAVVVWVRNRQQTERVTRSQPAAETASTESTTSNEAPTTTPSDSEQTQESAYAEPTREFVARATKKKFSDYFTPQTSPIQPERFTGYHTGVDIEFTDTTDDVPVYAMTDGTVVRSGWVSGYGGLLVTTGTVNDRKVFLLYGHIRPSTLLPVDTQVKKGEQIGTLGTGLTQETDNQRHHLHFAIYAGKNLDIRGYVQNESELSNWINPLDFF